MSSHRRAVPRVLPQLRIVLALVLSLVLLPFMAAPAWAVPTSINIDGNQDGVADDWQGLAAFPNGSALNNFSIVKDPVGTADTTTFGTGTSENKYPDWDAGNPGTASDKSDIGNVYVYDYRAGPDQDLMLALAWDRAGDTGTGRYYVELNQLPDQGLVPTRSVGDRRITIGINGSDDLECKFIERWSGTAWISPIDCDPAIPVVVNSSNITDYFNSPNDNPTGTLEQNTFLEAVINLTDFGATTCPVAGFQSLSIRSQEGGENGDTSALKDRATGAVDIPSDCGAIVIEKRDFTTGELVTVAGAKFQVDPNPTAGAADTSAKTVVDNNTSAADLTDTDPTVGRIKLTNVKPAAYTVTELQAPSGYLLPPPGCDAADNTDRCTTKTVGIGETVTFSFKDKRQYAAPTIQKNAAALYDAAYTWDIAKTVADADEAAGPDARQDIPQGSTATFDYAVTVDEVARNTSNFRVSGTLTLGNSNGLPMTVTIADALQDNTPCTFNVSDADGSASGHQVVIPANNNNYPVGYSCSPGNNAQDGKNIATLTWSKAAYPQNQDDANSSSPGVGTDSAEAGYQFQVDKETNKTVTITDDHHTFNPAWTNVWGEGDDPETRTYQKTFSGEAGTCTEYDNTATITQTQQSDSALATVCVGKDLVVTKNVVTSLTRTYSFGLSKSAEDTTLDVDPQTGKATADYTVTVTDGPAEDSDWVMQGKIFVSNPNDWLDVDLTDISDEFSGGDADCTITPPATGMEIVADATNVEFGYSCTFETQPTYDGTNTATITWDSDATPTGTAFGTATVEVGDWEVTDVDKTVTIVDDKTVLGAEHELGTRTWVKEGNTQSYTYSLQLQGVPGQCVDYTNIATVKETGTTATETVEVCAPLGVLVEKTGAGTYDRTYDWKIAKSADDTEISIDGGTATFDYTVEVTPDGFTDSGWTMTGNITVKNPNDFKTMTVDLTDVPNVGGGAQCSVANGDDVLVPAGALVDDEVVPGEASRSYSCTFLSKPDYSGGTNTAVATWADGQAQSAPKPITFSLDDETDKVVDVSDDKTLPGQSFDLGEADWFDGPTKFEYSVTKSGVAGECTDYTNTAVIEQTDQEAEEQVTLCVQAPLSIVKTVDATYDRTYLWQIDKVVDRDAAEVAEGGTADFEYDVTVGPATTETDPGYTDSGWVMEGTITVTNPNNAEVGSIIADVTDVTDVGGTCTVEGGTEVPIGPAESVTLDYECEFSDEPSYEGTNTAKAQWTGNQGVRSVTDEVDVTFELLEEIDRYIDVTDAFDGGDAELIEGAEELDWFDGEQTFTYTRSLGAPAGDCRTYDNVAEIVQTGQTDDASVQVCAEAALTIAKDVTATFDRTYAWEIEKAADQTVFETDGLSPAEVAYEVIVTPVVPEGGVYDDSGFEMGGTITVTNPNTYEEGAITASVTDVPSVGEGVTCTVPEGATVPLAPGASAELAYECEFEGRPDYLGSNVASAAWAGPGGELRTVSTEPELVSFVIDTEINKVIDVVDDKTVPGEEHELGPAEWNAEGTPTTFTYSLDLGAEANECETYTNIASIVQTEQVADETVEVCGPEILPDEVIVPRPKPEIKGAETVLPTTGGPQLGLTWAALVLLLAGGLLIVSSRMRRSRT